MAQSYRSRSRWRDKSDWIMHNVLNNTNGTFHLSELAGRTIARPVNLTMKSAFSKGFAEKSSPPCTLIWI